VFVVARTAGDPLAVAGAVRNEIRQLDSNLPVANIRPMREVVSSALATPRLTGFLLGAFAAIALANRGQVLAMILRHGVTLALAGVAVGVVGAFALTQMMTSLLYQVQPSDPVTIASVPLALIVVAAIASYLPALRATRVSPVKALRMD
jgi:hypothetical protein